MSFVNVYQFACVSFPFGLECGICDLIVLIPDHCLSFYFTLTHYAQCHVNDAWLNSPGLDQTTTNATPFHVQSTLIISKPKGL